MHACFLTDRRRYLYCTCTRVNKDIFYCIPHSVISISICNVEIDSHHSLCAGELGKYRTNTNTVTHISSSDIAEAGWGEESRGQGDLMLINMKVVLNPGHNKISVEGKVRRREGEEGRNEGIIRVERDREVDNIDNVGKCA